MAYKDPAVQLSHAHQIARDHGCQISERKTAKGREYLLYRIVSGRPVYLGKRSSERGIHALVCNACNFH